MSSEFNCPTCNKSFPTARRVATHAKTHLIEFVVIEPPPLSLIASESKKQPLTQLSKAELLEKCSELGFTKVKSKTKAELIALIEGDPLAGVKEEGSTKTVSSLVNAPNKAWDPKGTVSSLVKWSGGKSDEIKQFANHFPLTYDTYLEPFIGGGSVYFHLAPKKAVISDVHQELIDLYQSIKAGHAAEIHQFMTLHPNNEETYYKVRDKMAINSPLDNAKRFYYLRKTCFRGMLRYNKQGKFNIPFGRYDKINYSELLNPAYHELLEKTEIFKAGFEYIFENYNDPANFMFLDPPYDSEFTDYGYCQFGKEEQKMLAACFKSTKIKCMMIIGKTDFIVDLYKDYIVDSYKKNYKFKLYAGRIGSEINTEHLIIKNY
jgi:DNA adenine methylase